MSLTYIFGKVDGEDMEELLKLVVRDSIKDCCKILRKK